MDEEQNGCQTIDECSKMWAGAQGMQGEIQGEIQGETQNGHNIHQREHSNISLLLFNPLFN